MGASRWQAYGKRNSTIDMKKKQNTQSVKRPRIKKGDEVVVISGAYRKSLKGTVLNEAGERVENRPDSELRWQPRRVLAVYPKTNRILVEGVAVAQRSYKKGANPSFPEGGIHEKEMPIHISNVMLYDRKEDRPTRVGIREEVKTDGKLSRVRFSKASGTDIKD